MSVLWQQDDTIMRMAEGTFLLIACLLVTMVHFRMEPLRWKYSYLSAKQNANSSKNVRDTLFCTALYTYLLPFKLGIPLRVFLLRRYGGLTLHFIGIIIALDGLISLVVWSIMTASSLWLTALHWRPPFIVWILAFMAMGVITILFIFFDRLRGHWLRSLQEAIILLDSPWRRLATAATVLVFDVFSYGVRHALLVLLVTGDLSRMLMAGTIGIIATFAGMVSGLPMGLLGYDATLIALLALIGVPLDQALLVALINRGLNLSVATLLGVPAALRLGLGTGLCSILRKLRKLGHSHE